MSNPSAPQPPLSELSKERLAALSPEERRRIGVAMQFLVDVKALHLVGLQIGTDLLEGKVSGAEIGMKLMDFERDLRLAANEMLKRPLRVAHMEAFRKGETKLDEDPWNMRVRIKASDARKIREEKAREEKFRALTPPDAAEPIEEEPESDTGPRP